MVLVIVGSTRPVRVGDQLAQHIVPLLEESLGAPVNVVDLRRLGLPFLDEPRQPSDGNYAHAHTRAWSKTITESDAVIVITPQYNGGYPASVKTAIDFLYAEWRDKPFLVISYGSRGGPKCNAQLTEVLHYIHADPVEGGVQIVVPGSDYGPDDRLMHPAEHVAAFREAILVAAKELAGKIATHELNKG
ncbi:MAG: NADPH-dependent FMN reductase [Aeromicrobium sp.]